MVTARTLPIPDPLADFGCSDSVVTVVCCPCGNIHMETFIRICTGAATTMCTDHDILLLFSKERLEGLIVDGDIAYSAELLSAFLLSLE